MGISCTKKQSEATLKVKVLPSFSIHHVSLLLFVGRYLIATPHPLCVKNKIIKLCDVDMKENKNETCAAM
jgi:hypothetical protein